jgi:hypothetical protein
VASMTKAQIASATLEHMGVIAAGATAATADQALVEAVVDRVYARMRALDLVPFPVSAIPEWAQRQLIDVIARDAGPAFGVPANAMLLFIENAKRSESDLQRQIAGTQQPRTIEREYF